MEPEPKHTLTRRGQVAVMVVDDDDVARAGYAAILTSGPGIATVSTATVAGALDRVSWTGIDVVLVDPVDPRRRGDQVSGAALVSQIRAMADRPQPRIVVISSIQPDDAVRLRMREAGADSYYLRSQVREADRLLGAVLASTPDDGVPDPVDRELMHRLGITSRTRVNRGVAAAYAERLVPDAGWVGPRGRDRLARRARFNEEARLTPVGVDGRIPDRNQDVPSLAQIQRFVAWASRIGHHR